MNLYLNKAEQETEKTQAKSESERKKTNLKMNKQQSN